MNMKMMNRHSYNITTLVCLLFCSCLADKNIQKAQKETTIIKDVISKAKKCMEEDDVNVSMNKYNPTQLAKDLEQKLNYIKKMKNYRNEFASEVEIRRGRIQASLDKSEDKASAVKVFEDFYLCIADFTELYTQSLKKTASEMATLGDNTSDPNYLKLKELVPNGSSSYNSWLDIVKEEKGKIEDSRGGFFGSDQSSIDKIKAAAAQLATIFNRL